MSRIRQALKTAPKLRTASDSKTDFKVEVNETQRFQDLLDLLDLSGVGSTIPDVLFPTTATPLFSVNATGLGVSISKAVARARRERAERLAREEVRRALDEYCAAHECPSPR